MYFPLKKFRLDICSSEGFVFIATKYTSRCSGRCCYHYVWFTRCNEYRRLPGAAGQFAERKHYVIITVNSFMHKMPVGVEYNDTPFVDANCTQAYHCFVALSTGRQ